jgi:hypothetical protein
METLLSHFYGIAEARERVYRIPEYARLQRDFRQRSLHRSKKFNDKEVGPSGLSLIGPASRGLTSSQS